LTLVNARAKANVTSLTSALIIAPTSTPATATASAATAVASTLTTSTMTTSTLTTFIEVCLREAEALALIG
jgi:hypothetical protein